MTTIQPPKDAPDSNPAAEVIRRKIDELYANEPSAERELDQTQGKRRLSKHQAFIQQLSTSGKSLAEIQTAWHEYYVNLPDDEKHEVWQEFYASTHRTPPTPAPATHRPAPTPVSANAHVQHRSAKRARKNDFRTVSEIKRQLLGKVSGHGRLSRKHHLQSLAFGLATGSAVLLLLLFGFFNERFIAPFISPSRHVSNTPIIIDSASTTADAQPKIVIPKINVEIPVVYDLKTVDEKAIQKSLEQGVVHYASTALPGEQGNAAIVGHSSNNILNKGKYKFAFVLLNRLEPGDTFFLTRGGKRYVYKVFQKRVVKPTDFSVLEPVPGKPAVATLITCDPPGTSANRLIVTAEQISPDPSSNVPSSAVATTEKPAVMPGNAPSLWQRLRDWLAS